MIKRERYLKPIRAFYDSDLVKVITGIRRSGKSVILGTIRKEIEARSNNIIALDFEDVETQLTITDSLSLINYVADRRREGLCYVFLDEIQRLDGWADACRTLRLRQCSVFISGSNSKLLSREFTKELSGRYVAFRVRPFVYQELQAYASELGKTVSVMDYLVWGGFPKRIEFNDLETQRQYLNDLNETIILNDIINRYGIRKTELFKRLANYVLISNGRIFSARSVGNYMKENGLSCSMTTVTKYIGYLEEAYAIEPVKLFSNKAKRELSYYQKMYDGDVSFNSIRAIGNRYDLTHNFENIVYNELVYRGYTLNVYNDGKHEIDFVATKEGKKYYIQAAYSVAEEKAYNREFGAFANLDNTHQKILISNDEVDFSTSTVRHIPFKAFLLMPDF